MYCSSNFFPVLMLGLVKQKEKKSVIVYCSLKFIMVNLQVQRKQGLKDAVLCEFVIGLRKWYFIFKRNRGLAFVLAD